MPEFIREKVRLTPIGKRVEVLVAGGGPAGIGAAVASSRCGARTLLVERLGFVGGMLTAGGVRNMRTFTDGTGQAIIRGIPYEFAEYLKKNGAARGCQEKDAFIQQNPELTSYLATEFVLSSGAGLLLHSVVVDVIKKGDRIGGVIVENKSGRQAILSEVVVDCTADGDVCRQAGAKMRKESVMPMTMTFSLENVSAWPLVRTPEIYQAFRRHLKDYPLPSHSLALFALPEKGLVYANVTRVFGDASQVEDLTRAEIEGRRQVMKAIEFYRKYLPGYQGARLRSFGIEIGTRESWRLVGRYTLTARDVLSGRDFPDVIARAAYGIDVHDSHGPGSTMIHLKPGTSYAIPYRCLLPEKIEGLLVAGRCLSASRKALASCRVMVTCMATGQAAGVAAALASQKRVLPSQLDVSSLQQHLLQQGVVLWKR
ncbi:MAG: FAD-dependent oxidoreductase [Candidatus Omnitrophica bacterium]|nr:FAD-dependent oxidoreductase [Candidatus Omnitrophota bacterium]